MSQLAEISLYCRQHDITAEKWSRIPKSPFQASCGNESLTSADPSGIVHDDVIISTDFVRITSPELKIAPKPAVLGCANVESIPTVSTYVHHHHSGDPIFISAPSIPIWTDANDIAVGGERVEDSFLDSRFGHNIAGGATTMETSEHALVDSGCGKSTIPTTATTGQTKVHTAYRQLKEMMLRVLASLIGSFVGAARHATAGC
jgi:hypothetical protein